MTAMHAQPEHADRAYWDSQARIYRSMANSASTEDEARAWNDAADRMARKAHQSR